MARGPCLDLSDKHHKSSNTLKNVESSLDSFTQIYFGVLAFVCLFVFSVVGKKDAPKCVHLNCYVDN